MVDEATGSSKLVRDALNCTAILMRVLFMR